MIKYAIKISCASCINFKVLKASSKESRFICSKDGRNWTTDPKWKFDCWIPNKKMKKLLNK